MNKEKFYDYDGFLEKFNNKKHKMTTDDCYTPPAVYEVVLQHVRDAYGIDESTPIVRPFYPGGDYEHYDYSGDCVVVDNPPFSIFSKILDYYLARGIRFFLFAPSSTALGVIARRTGITLVATCYKIVYENGALVNTSFVTNMSPDYIVQTNPQFRERIKRASEQNRTAKKVRKLLFPENVLSFKDLYVLAKVDFSILREEAATIPRVGKNSSAFGGGNSYLNSQIRSQNKSKSRIKSRSCNNTSLTERKRVNRHVGCSLY